MSRSRTPSVVAKQYPHQLSGGMRQRVMIAMALACKPKLLIADEPTTALDVTIQAQILKLMNDLKREHGTAIMFITHDLGVINQMADDVAVMYCGQVVEHVPARTLFAHDVKFSHPYTEGLMESIPRLDTTADRARRHSRRGAAPAEPAEGLQICAALQVLHEALPQRGARDGARERRSSRCAASTPERRSAVQISKEKKVLLRVSNLKQYFPAEKEGPLSSRPTTALRWISMRARPSAWSASPAAASPRWAARCCSSTPDRRPDDVLWPHPRTSWLPLTSKRPLPTLASAAKVAELKKHLARAAEGL